MLANNSGAAASEPSSIGSARPAADQMRSAIRSDLPPIAQTFLAEQSGILLSAYDADGALWTTSLSGPTGFLSPVVDDAGASNRLQIAAWPAAGDPLAERLAEPAMVGLLALHPPTRRRMRVNGSSRPLGPGARSGLEVRAEEVFANCGRHITAHPLAGTDPRARSSEAVRVRRGSGRLTLDQVERVRSADTFILGTADDAGNVDTSHRGGPPGFVEVVAPDRLRFTDYPGNAMYLTLGNLEVEPRASILFPAWARGRMLQLSGRAAVHYPAAVGGAPTVELTIDAWVDSWVDTQADSWADSEPS